MDPASINGTPLRDVMLVCAIVLFWGSLLINAESWMRPFSRQGAIVALLVMVSGLVAVLAVKAAAGILFDLHKRPWYGQPGASLFLPMILVAVNAICIIMADVIAGLEVGRHRRSHISLFLALWSVELLWVILLDLPRPPFQSTPSGIKGRVQSSSSPPSSVTPPLGTAEEDLDEAPPQLGPRRASREKETQDEEVIPRAGLRITLIPEKGVPLCSTSPTSQ